LGLKVIFAIRFINFKRLLFFLKVVSFSCCPRDEIRAKGLKMAQQDTFSSNGTQRWSKMSGFNARMAECQDLRNNREIKSHGNA